MNLLRTGFYGKLVYNKWLEPDGKYQEAYFKWLEVRNKWREVFKPIPNYLWSILDEPA